MGLFSYHLPRANYNKNMPTIGWLLIHSNLSSLDYFMVFGSDLGFKFGLR